MATLLLIHDLHPVPLEERVREALEQVRPYMESHGGNVELLSLEDGVARLRLEGSCSDCSASAVTLELAIKQALEEAAPDLEGLEVEGVARGRAAARRRRRGPDGPAAARRGLGAGLVRGWRLGRLARRRAGVAPTSPAPRWWWPTSTARCSPTATAAPAAAEPLHDGELEAGALALPGCARTFFLPRAGRSMDDERLQLEPVPLLREQGT